MSSFDDIQVGDTVLQRVQAPTVSFNVHHYFWTPVRVERVTKTQFVTASGERYWKKSGWAVSTNSIDFVVREGQKQEWPMDDAVYSDESAALAKFVANVEKINKCSSIINGLRLLIDNLRARPQDIDLGALESALVKAQDIAEGLRNPTKAKANS